MAGTDSYTSRGGGSDAMRQRRAQDQKLWAEMLKMANANTPQTMLGFGIGKLLRGAWDHYWNRKAENTNLDGNVQARPDNTAYTYSVGDYTVPQGAPIDTAKPSYYGGIAPTKGLLGSQMPIAMTAGQAQQTVEDSAGNKQTTTVNTAVTIQGSPTLADAVQRIMQNNPALGQQNYTLADLFKKNSYHGY
jgi:hypothetical protein